ncbi:hypothetical protein [Cellulosilyticum ruminicola]|uniref:hypothetical protein n=1 Tax=Cellulosilyticum ruminicola TaxID=425254 RepID=UPI0012ED13C7|nr:hypothetical protein [Cellulosilyticum ruminicola]
MIEIFKKLIVKYHLEEVIELTGAFCTGNCTKAVAVYKGMAEVNMCLPFMRQKQKH